MGALDFEWIIVYGTVIFLAIGLHEYAHCKVADMAGDPTPRDFGRVTLNLTKHFEPMGTMMIIFTTISGFGIGWGRPAPINPSKMNNPRWDTLAAVIAGPASNILQAAIWAMIFRLMLMAGPELLFVQGGPTMFGLFLQLAVYVNLVLAFFNLIPFGPLDGHWIVGQLLPEKPRFYWYKFNRGVGTYILFAIIIGSQLMSSTLGFNLIWDTIGPIANALYTFFTGMKGLVL